MILLEGNDPRLCLCVPLPIGSLRCPRSGRLAALASRLLNRLWAPVSNDQRHSVDTTLHGARWVWHATSISVSQHLPMGCYESLRLYRVGLIGLTFGFPGQAYVQPSCLIRDHGCAHGDATLIINQGS